MHHFLLIYNHKNEQLEGDPVIFDSEELDAATAAYQEAENRYRDSEGIEIVLIGADSLRTIAHTHGHYLSKSEDKLEKYLAEVRD
jgi:hypothetical protein